METTLIIKVVLIINFPEKAKKLDNFIDNYCDTQYNY